MVIDVYSAIVSVNQAVVRSLVPDVWQVISSNIGKYCKRWEGLAPLAKVFR